MVAKQEKPTPQRKLHIKGKVDLQKSVEPLPQTLDLRAYVFDLGGQLLGSEPIDLEEGAFEIPVQLEEPAPVELFIAPEGDPQRIRNSAAFRRRLSVEEWTGDEGARRLTPEITLGPEIWRPWLPIRVCVSGRVRKVPPDCPVPYAKVEVFDVDREACLWPYFERRWEELLERPVVHLPELLEEPSLPRIPREPPFPPEPQPQPPFPPQPRPEPPLPEPGPSLDELTITSRTAPWRIFPRCFHSRDEVCETTTDEQGRFQCCFDWWPFHFRWGRFRYDARPDIVVRVTQEIDGVERVIYLDPYNSTRWNVNRAYIDLQLDDPEIQCGSGDQPERPEGTTVFFTRIGRDEVYDIDQSSGLYNPPGPTAQAAYGHTLDIFALFGDTLSRQMAAGGATPPYYYRLSYSKDGTNFTPVTTTLKDTRVAKSSLFSESHTLGPVTVNGVPALYEVRDFGSYYWYNPDWIGVWPTHAIEEDTDRYTLRLEIYDANGNKLDSSVIDYRDGTQNPGGTLPTMGDSCDLALTIDNKPPELNLQIPAVLNSCGVIPFSQVPPLDFNVDVTQENGRLRMWRLEYTKGTLSGTHTLAGNSSPTGALSPVHTTVNGNSLLTGLTSTCAFSLKLLARPHIRNGYSWIYYREEIDAIAIEKCPDCPPCPPEES
jgi:hypothetical protein